MAGFAQDFVLVAIALFHVTYRDLYIGGEDHSNVDTSTGIHERLIY